VGRRGGGNVKVANRRGLLGLIQHCEYVLATSLDRRMYDVLDCMVTVPGAVGASAGPRWPRWAACPSTRWPRTPT